LPGCKIEIIEPTFLIGKRGCANYQRTLTNVVGLMGDPFSSFSLGRRRRHETVLDPVKVGPAWSMQAGKSTVEVKANHDSSER